MSCTVTVALIFILFIDRQTRYAVKLSSNISEISFVSYLQIHTIDRLSFWDIPQTHICKSLVHIFSVCFNHVLK